MRALPRVVVVLGFVSLLTDVASEMVYPLLPTLLLAAGGGALSLGAIEGVGDATAAVGKLIAGKISDGSGRKGLVLAGYGLSALTRPILAFAFAPWQIIGVRFVDRIGKGMRSSPRDALIARSVSREDAGAAFGFHRAMDNVGATIGPLLTFALLAICHHQTRPVLLATLVPGVLAVLLIVWLVRDDPEPVPSRRPEHVAELAAARAGEEPAKEPDVVAGEEGPPSRDATAALRAYLLILGVFALANTSDLFLLRRLSELGATTSQVALLWAFLSGVRALSGYPGGVFADRVGRARALQLGFVVYAAAYFAMARAQTLSTFATAMMVYGLYYGFTEGAERALLAGLVPRAVLGASFGRFHLVIGLAMLPSNLLFGYAWSRLGPQTCLTISAGMALLASVALGLFVRKFGNGLRTKLI
jgi:MFS family permease